MALSVEETIDALMICGSRVPSCKGCPYAGKKKFPLCFDFLKMEAMQHLKALAAKQSAEN